MKLLHTHSGNMFGGVERMLETLAPLYAGETPIHSAYALCFAGRTAEALRAAGGAVHHLGPVRSRRVDEIWRARRALRAVLSSGPWDAVCVHSAWSQGMFGPTILKAGLPLVRWLHAPAPGPRWMEAWAARSHPALVICNSDFTRQASQVPMGSAPVVVCHPPARPLPSRVDARARIRQRLGTPEATPVIVIAARLEPWKGHAALVDALGTLQARAWELWIVGGPHGAEGSRYLGELEAGGAPLGPRVRFLGEQEDVAAWLAAADIYCQPNLSPEPFGLAFVEALGAGLPVVTTRIGAAPEIVDGTCGVLTTPGSREDLAAALGSLIDDRAARDRLGAGARLRARDFTDLPAALARLARALAPVSAPALSLT